MVHILANIVQVIVFAASTDALLTVDSPGQSTHATVGVNGTLKDWFELKLQTLLILKLV